MAIGAWLLTMVAIPIAGWTLGDGALRFGIVLGVLLQATAVLLILTQAWGWYRTLKTAVIITVGTLIVEIIGSHTGIPFGQYHYTDLLQPQIAGVPLLIPFAWFMMLPCAWAVAYPFRHSRWRFILISALALTAWDLFLDPQMVNWQLWIWDQPGGYFGIPWSNYVGWFCTSALLTYLVQPDRLPVTPLLSIYALTWFLELFGLLFFWGLVGPALVGGLGMGYFVWISWRHLIVHKPFLEQEQVLRT